MRKSILIIVMLFSLMNFGVFARAEGSEILLNEGTNIFVSPDGDDNNNGAIDAPFKTIKRAQARAAIYKNMGKKIITIYLRAGKYDTFSLTGDYSGSETSKIIYSAYPGEEVIISSGLEIEKFDVLEEDNVSWRFPEAAKRYIVTYDLSDFNGDWSLKGMANGGIIDMCARLYVDGETMNIARWPNEDYIKISDIGSASENKITFNDSAIPAKWALNQDTWIAGYSTNDWKFVRCNITGMDDNIISVNDSFKNASRVYFYNIPEELDAPGEYYIDKDTQKLYFYPPEVIEDKRVVLSVEDSPVTIKNCNNISVENLVIEGSRGNGISVSQSENIIISDCIVRDCGTSGIVLNESKNCTIADNNIYNVGGRGISCTQYTFIQNLLKGNVLITNNRIHDYGQVTRTYAAGIYIHGVENMISHNEIYNYEHTGIMFGGNENVFEYNDIHDILTDTNDAGAIYAGRTWISRGNILRYNYIHDCPSVAGKQISGIYLDDMMADVTSFGNVIDNVSFGFMLCGGHNNVIENNIIANSKGTVALGDSISADSRGTEAWFSNNFEFNDGENYLQNCSFVKEFIDRHCLTSKAWLEKYPDLRDILRKNFREPQDNIIKNNIIYSHTEPNVHENVIKNGVVGNNVVFSENPGFNNPEEGDYSYEGEILEGFSTIPCDKFGIIERGQE